MQKRIGAAAVVGVCLLAFIFVAVQAAAQDFRSTLTGQVTDQTGAVIPKAQVKAVETSSGTTYTAMTTNAGVYYIPYMLPGTYTVTASAKGFQTAVQEKVTLFASQTFNHNFKLSVGAAAQRVVVTAAPPQLETSTGSGGTIISQRELQSVPLNGGQAYMLIGTTPGSQFTQTKFGPGGFSGTRGWDANNSYSLGGGVVGNNQFTLNGINITSQYSYNDQSAGEWTVSPNIDSIKEVNVMTNTYDARYGRTSGGIVNTVSRSGTNQFHGSARYAYEGTLFSANTYQNNLVGVHTQPRVQNQFWLTAGGPIIKNRLFFFFGFEGYRESIAGSVLENVAPAYLRPGFNGDSGVNFGLVKQMDPQEFPNGISVFQPGTATCLDGGPATACDSNHVVQQPFANDSIPGTMMNPTALAVLKFIPLPNIPGTANSARGNNYLASTPDLYSYNQPQIRVDYNLTDKTKLYSYFLWWKGHENRDGNGLPGIAANGNINHIRENWVAAQDVTHVFSPTLVGDFKASFSRFVDDSPNGDLTKQTSPSTIGLAMPLPGTTSSQYLPQFNVSDGWGTGIIGGGTIFGNNLDISVTNNYVLSADFTKSAGAHNFEFGGQVAEFQFGGQVNGGGNPNGAFNFGSDWTALNPHNGSCFPIDPGNGNSNQCNSNTPNGSSLASFYLGDPDGGHINWDASLMDGYPVYSLYFQDNWRVTPRLTLNLGIRYDVQRGLRERYNQLNRGLCLTCVNPITNNANYQSNIANGASQAAWTAAGINPATLQKVLGGLQFAGYDGQSRDAYNTDYSDVGPRFGFAFALDPKTVIRGGYGVMYSYGLEGGSSAGFAQTTNYTSSVDGGNTPTTNFQSGKPFASGLVHPTGNSLGMMTDLGNGGVQADFPDRNIPMEQLVSLGVQRALPGNFVLDASFDGNYTSRLRTFLWINGTATLPQLQAAVANPQIWDKQVPNPYYGVPGMSGPGECGTGTTVSAITLLLPLSQYCHPGGPGLVGQFNAPLGRNWYDALEVKLSRRISHGFTMNLAYTYSKTMDGDGYQNGWPYQDPFQHHWIGGNDRTHILSVTSVWNLPFGEGGLLFTHPNAFAGRLINGWVLSGVFSAQSGVPVGLDSGWYYTCPSQSFRPKGGTSVGGGRWFNTDSSCWHGIPAWALMNLPGRTAQIRQPTIPNLDLSVHKTTAITERLKLSLRLDAFNSLNSVLFGGPNTNPGAGPATFNPHSGWSGFGTVGATQQNFPRILQVGGKITF